MRARQIRRRETVDAERLQALEIYRWADKLTEVTEPEAAIGATLAKCREVSQGGDVTLTLSDYASGTSWQLDAGGSVIRTPYTTNERAPGARRTMSSAFNIDGAGDGVIVVSPPAGGSRLVGQQILDVIGRGFCSAFTSALRLREWNAESEARAFDALHDPLTGLANRKLFATCLGSLLATASPEAPVAVVVVDLDGFKDVNAALGEMTGDALLVEAARRIEACSAHGSCVARLGDDEFAVAAQSSAGSWSVAEIGQRLVTAIEKPLTLDGVQLRLAVTVGLSEAPLDGSVASDLVGKAEIARGRARLSRQRVVSFTQSLDWESKARLEMTRRLEEAIDGDRLEVWYQPVARTGDGTVTGVEALARWSGMGRGYISPSEFIPIAEQSGTIGRLTWWVIERALSDAENLRAQGFDLTVAVNLSPEILHIPDVLQRVATALEGCCVPPDKLLLEVTESAFISETPLVFEALSALTRLGIRVAIDDFGTGYSSLARLRDLPVDTIKVDRSFVSAMSFDSTDAAIVKAILELARSMGHSVVAEGVEDRDTWDTLRNLGCDLMQGFVLAPAMPLGTVEDWLGAHAAGTHSLL